jgi:F-type H+-transporting ATPase subunit epsilon
MYLEIVTPEKTLFSGEVIEIIVPGSDGSFGIRENHAPIVAVLKDGEIEFTDTLNSKQKFNVKGGIVEVLKNNIIVLAN